MRKSGFSLIAILVAAQLAASACSPADPAHASENGDGNAQTTVATDAPADANGGAVAAGVTWPAGIDAVTLADSIDRRLRHVRNLTRNERTQLRRDVNAIQIERARQLGIPVGASVQAMVDAGRLVRLEEANPRWVVRPLKYSEPYLTPSAVAMLTEIGERFQAKLDSLAIPPYRLDITSVLRTPENHAALRRANSNASKVESAHEFGTTVDIAYRRFAAPMWSNPDYLGDSLIVKTGNLRSAELQAVLGRVLADMQAEQKLLVRMERRQTVYHITVGRELAKQ
jgi:hypothetical protein